MLKLVVNNTDLFSYNPFFNRASQDLNLSQESPQETVIFDCRQIIPHLYTFSARDLAHELACHIDLEVKQATNSTQQFDEEDRMFFSPVISGIFQRIDTQRLSESVKNDDYLQSMILAQFQLQILEQLMLLCEDMGASHLHLYFPKDHVDLLEIYRCFLIMEEGRTNSCAENIEITIPTDARTYDNLIDFMDHVSKTFRQTLWYEQGRKPLLRQYLKSLALV